MANWMIIFLCSCARFVMFLSYLMEILLVDCMKQGRGFGQRFWLPFYINTWKWWNNAPEPDKRNQNKNEKKNSILNNFQRNK